MGKTLALLLVEDSKADALLINSEFGHHGYELRSRRVETATAFETALKLESWDAIIADFALPKFSATAALVILQKLAMDIPFVIVSGFIGEETAVQAMKAGAHDYIMKDKLARLVPAVERELRDATVRRERRRAEVDLRHSRDQLRALAARLQSVREEERKRITRDIHDELGQALTGFKMDLAWIRNRLQSDEASARRAVIEKVAGMGELIDATAGTIRKLCAELRPGILDDLGLGAAIEWQAREFEKRTGIQCVARLNATDLPLGSEQATAVFRIFQEVLTNVARHAQATEVKVLLESNDTRIVLKVADNGRGIRENELAGSRSLGLLGMRERALIIGAALDVAGVPDKGTTVSLTLPLESIDPHK